MTRKTILTLFVLCTCSVVLLLWGRHAGSARALRRALHEKYVALTGRARTSKPVKRPEDNDFESTLLRRLRRLETDSSHVHRGFFPEDTLVELRARVPRGKPLEWIVWYLGRDYRGTSYEIADCREGGKDVACTMEFVDRRKKGPRFEVILARGSRYFSDAGLLAIIVEQFGFAADNTTVAFLSFPHPLTVSLVPEKNRAGWTAEIVDEYHKEILVHLPLESASGTRPGDDIPVIMVHYPEEKIREMVLEAMQVIPNFAGVANFMGSRATADTRVMRIVLEEVRKRHGYFVDMCTSRESVIPSLARKLRVPLVEVRHTIDREADTDRVERRLEEFAVLARNRGKLVVGGVGNHAMITALRNKIDALRRGGIKPVYVSEILAHPG